MLQPTTPRSEDSELDKVLDDIFFEHEDSDHKTCSSLYYTCRKCDEVTYYQNTAKHKHGWDVQKKGECDCSTKDHRAEAKAKMTLWRDKHALRERRVELKQTSMFVVASSLNTASKHKLYRYLSGRDDELKAQLKALEGEKDG